MQFIANDNLKSVLRNGTNATSIPFKDTSGTTRTLYSSERNRLAFWGKAGTQTATGNDWAMPFASSSETVTASDTSISNQVGTTTINYTITSKGWRAVITVTGQQGDIIRHLIFVKKLGYGSSSWIDAILYALKLDNPVTIDSTGTANFTFEIEF